MTRDILKLIKLINIETTDLPIVKNSKLKVYTIISFIQLFNKICYFSPFRIDFFLKSSYCFLFAFEVYLTFWSILADFFKQVQFYMLLSFWFFIEQTFCRLLAVCINKIWVLIVSSVHFTSVCFIVGCYGNKFSNLEANKTKLTLLNDGNTTSPSTRKQKRLSTVINWIF